MKYIMFLFLALGLRAQFVTVDVNQFVTKDLEQSTHGKATGVLVYGALATAGDATWAGKVILLDRGGVSFFAKVQAVQASGGIACIVANNVPGIAFSGALGAGNTSPLPAVMVSMEDGLALRAMAGSVATVGPSVTQPLIPALAGQDGKYLIAKDGKLTLTSALPAYPTVSSATTVNSGESVTFAVRAEGKAPFFYQWAKDGVILTGSTAATITIASAQPADAGVYTCQVSNDAGATPSEAYTLTVNPTAPQSLNRASPKI